MIGCGHETGQIADHSSAQRYGYGITIEVAVYQRVDDFTETGQRFFLLSIRQDMHDNFTVGKRVTDLPQVQGCNFGIGDDKNLLCRDFAA